MLSWIGVPASLSAQPVVMSADETLDLPLVITSQSKAQSAVSTREVADAVIRNLSAELPGVTLRHLVDGDVDACRLDVTCLAETRAALPPSPRTTGGLMVIVETSPSGPALSLFAWVYDLEAIALKRSHGELPESIQASTSRCESVPTEVADAAALDEALRVALAPCTAPLRARLLPRAPARLVLRGIPPNGVVALDGRTLGLVGSSSVAVVSSVRPGARQLDIRAERFEPYQASIDVVAPQTTLAIRLERERRLPIMLIAATATAAAESKFGVICPVNPSTCIDADGDWVQSGGVDPTSGPSGFPVAPIGISSFAAGVVWMTSDLVLAEEGIPVFTVLAGLAAAGLAAAVSVGTN